MLRRLTYLFAFAALAHLTFAWADDDIYQKGKTGKTKALVTAESPKEIALKNGDKIKESDLDDVFYDLPASSPTLVILGYRNGFAAEREFLDTNKDPKVRAKGYTEAIDKYEKTVGQVPDKRVKRQLEFKLGYLRGKKALEDGSDPKAAIVRLAEFTAKNPQAWEVVRAQTMLAKLQLENKDYAAAEQSFNQLAKLDVADEVKQDAHLQAALLTVQQGKYAAAESKLAELLKSLPKESKAYPRALVAHAECLMASNKTDEAMDILKKTTKESSDKAIKAVAYNTLGANYYKNDQLKEARWEFLWVDVVYNQDKNEHARALYYLTHIFEKLAEPEKADECRELLLNDKTFAGTDYQRRMQKERAK
jgi:uncharacterized protein HemY